MWYPEPQCGCNPPGCRVDRFAYGVNRTFVVLNESALLGFSPGELQQGDDVIIIQPTSRTVAYGVVKFVNPSGSGWGQFTIMGGQASAGSYFIVVPPPLTLQNQPTLRLPLGTFFLAYVAPAGQLWMLEAGAAGAGDIQPVDYNAVSNNVKLVQAL